MDYNTRKLIGLTDENLSFPEEWLKEEKSSGVTGHVIEARLDYTPLYCPNCGSKNEGRIIKNGTHKTKIQLLPIRSFKTELALTKTRFLCKECQGTFNAQTPLVEKNCFISSELKRKIAMELAVNASRKDIAHRYFVSDVTVTRIMRDCVKDHKPRFDQLPSVLCFDEFKAMKDCEGKMCFIYMDGHTHQIQGVLESRRLAYLRTHFLRYTRKARARVKYIVMDMNAPYFELAKSIFPNAQIVTDRFHIIQHVNRSFNSLRIQVMKSYQKSDHLKYKRLKRFWKLLLKDSDKLDSSNYRYNFSFRRPMTEKSIIDEILTYDATLNLAYEAVQLLLYHFKQRDALSFFDVINTMDDRLPGWFKKKLSFLNKYRTGITNAFHTQYSNGPLEGTNNKIKVIKRVAYGYRNFFNLRARIYIIQGLIFQDNTQTKKNSPKLPA